jgi:hypothetical protein
MINEEYLQEQSDQGKSDSSVDALAYRKVFEALTKETPSSLSPNFADNVMFKVLQQRTSRFSAFEIMLAVIGGLFCIITLFVAIMLTGFKLQLGFLEAVSGYKGVFIFGTAVIIVLHWVDKIVVRKKLPV